MKFENYLKTKGLKPASVKSYNGTVKYFKAWVKTENIPVEEISYADMLVYINVLIEKGDKKNTINGKLKAVTHYYDYLKQNGAVKTNPAETLRIRNVIRKLPQELLSEKTLDKIYQAYPEDTLHDKRDKTMLSLIIYQGLTKSDLEVLKPAHINLKDGKIQIPENGRNNERTIELKVFQIIGILEYINEIRPELLKTTGKQTDRLFTGTGTSNKLNNTFMPVRKKLRNISDEFKDMKQIRASVITNLLKHKNLREVQYFAGHRYVSSTERYLINNIENLKKEVDKYHPLK